MIDQDLNEWTSAETWAEALLIALDRVERLRAYYGSSSDFRQAVWWCSNRYARNGRGYWVISSHKRGGKHVGRHRAVAGT